MIIIKIHGGLGNQLFQYVLGQYFETINKVDIRYDITHFHQNRHAGRKFELADIIPKEKIAGQREIDRIKLAEYHNPFQAFFNKRLRRYSRSFIEEPPCDSTSFNQKMLKLKSGYLDGYWQNIQYLLPIEKEVRRSWGAMKISLPSNEGLFGNKSQSVAVHVRRGDYLKLNIALDEQYYHRALECLTTMVGVLNLFVFSDDPLWVRENMKFPIDCVYVDKGAPLSDLFFMSKCNHHIIANSTFSWWAAWLNDHPEKVVMFPKDWQLGVETAKYLSEWHGI